jgi:hypothetical protein
VTTPTAPLLPAGARLVHIGPHKTGSTAIQVAFQEARPQLAEHGVVYASGGKGHRPDKAGWAFGVRGRPAGSEQPPMKFWKQLVREVAEGGDQRVCVSNEDFGRATAQQARKLVNQLGGEAVHVIAVARRLDRYLPSQWQERVKAGDTRDYDTWLRVVLDTDDDEFAWDRKNVWFSHDVGDLVGRWVDVVGPERFTLIVSDESDREMLPRTFESMLGLPAQTLKPNPSRSNRGLTWAETELVRAVNTVVADAGWDRAQRRRYVKRGVLADMQRRPVPAGPKSPPLPAWAADNLRERSERRIEQIRSLGVHVVGDPESMRMPADVPTATPPLEAPALDLDIAAAAVAAVVDLALRDSGQEPGDTPED